jgi:pimeloyl-ACP methyl ester carboxylesterase
MARPFVKNSMFSKTSMQFQPWFTMFFTNASCRLGYSAILAAVIGIGCIASHTFAADPQAKTTGKTTEKKTVKAKDSDKDKELPPKRDLVLTTDDGLQLGVSYYPGTKGENTIPVVMLHMWKQSRVDYDDLALYLQKQGHACIVPDLRGHGESKRFKGSSRDSEDIIATNLRREHYDEMVVFDMKAVKDFLWECNNKGELNIDKLCVVGAEMGAMVAMNFAVYDSIGYEKNMISYGPLKLGEFVKAMVLISPDWTFKGMTLKNAISNPRIQRDISILLLVGKEDKKALVEAKRFLTFFERFHIEPTGDDKAGRRTLFFVPFDTSLQGAKLLDPKFEAREAIADFIDRRLNASDESQDWTWKERKRPHE